MARTEGPVGGFRPIEVPVQSDPKFKPIEVQVAAPVAASQKPATGKKED
jgi:hypothetical protein